MSTSHPYKSMLADLVALGLTQVQVAKRLGVTKASVHDALNSRDWVPRHPVGERLIALHRETLGSTEPAPPPTPQRRSTDKAAAR